MPIRHIDVLKTPLATDDIGLIEDEANELSPRRVTRPQVPPLGKNLADIVAHAQTATQVAFKPLTLPW